MKKKIAGILLTAAMFLGCTATPVMAATTTATLNSDKSQVTTTYDDCKGSTIVYVKGYEVNPTTGHAVLYNKSKSTTSTGSVTFTHDSDAAYRFQLYYNSTALKSKVVVNGATVAEVTVTY